MRLADRILEHWKSQEGDFPGEAKDYEICRNRPGYWQRANGAWSWSLVNKKLRYQLCGSQYTATECAKKGFTVMSAHGSAELWPKT